MLLWWAYLHNWLCFVNNWSIGIGQKCAVVVMIHVCITYCVLWRISQLCIGPKCAVAVMSTFASLIILFEQSLNSSHVFCVAACVAIFSYSAVLLYHFVTFSAVCKLVLYDNVLFVCLEMPQMRCQKLFTFRIKLNQFVMFHSQLE